MVEHRVPTVSIGMPVYNGEPYINEALDSLLAQDHADFEIIISDNASTDNTQGICLDYAARDNRIRYFRNEENIGGVANFNKVFDLSSGEFFMWAGHHDLWSPFYIKECLRKLNENPSAVLCFSPVKLIDSEGAYLGSYDENIDTTDLDMFGRLHVVLWRLRWKLGAGAAIYGLIRSEAMRMARNYQNVYGPDWILLAELSLIGSFVKVTESLFCLRDAHPQNRTIKDQWVSLNLANKKKDLFLPFNSLTLGIVKGVMHAKVRWWMKPILILDVLYSMSRKFHLGSELISTFGAHLKTHIFRFASHKEN